MTIFSTQYHQKRGGFSPEAKSPTSSKEVQSGCEECNVVISTCPNKIFIEGLNGPNVIVQVFDSGWSEVFSCLNNCANPSVITGLLTGNYYVKVYMAGALWNYYCIVEQWVSVPGVNLMAPEHSSITNGEKPDAFKMENAAPVISAKNGGEKQLTAPGTPEFAMHPNPASRTVTLEWDGAATGQKILVNMYNSLGQLVKTQKLDDASSSEYKLDLSDLSGGQYIVQLIPEGKAPMMKKLAVSH